MDQLFIFFSFVIISSSVMTIISINPIHSIFWLVLVFISSAGLLISMGFEFLGLMLIIIYVGAITILFLFVIMMLDIFQIRKNQDLSYILPITLIGILNIVLQIGYMINDNVKFYYQSIKESWDFNTINHITNLSSILYTDYFIPFIILSLLLLVAMIGAIVLTLENNILTKRQMLSNQHQRNNSWV